MPCTKERKVLVASEGWKSITACKDEADGTRLVDAWSKYGVTAKVYEIIIVRVVE